MALSYNGSTQYTTVPDSAAIKSGAGVFTVAVWQRSSVTQNEDARVFSSGNGGGGTSGGKRYELYFSTNLIFALDDNGTKSEAVYATVTDLSDGNYHLWICERNGSTIKIFEDGDTERASTTDSTGDTDTSDTLIIGAGRFTGDTITGFWQGDIANWMYFDRVLTGPEKDALYNGISPILSQVDAFLPLWGHQSSEIQLINGGPTAATSTASPVAVNHCPGDIFPTTPTGMEVVATGDADNYPGYYTNKVNIVRSRYV